MKIPLFSWLSFILCLWLWIYLSIHISVVSGHCLEDQRSRHLRFKKDIRFHYDNFGKLASWGHNIDCCEWGGLSCDINGRVVGLNLSEPYIPGEIIKSGGLFSLQDLQSLNMAKNNFNFVVPSGFHKLKLDIPEFCRMMDLREKFQSRFPT